MSFLVGFLLVARPGTITSSFWVLSSHIIKLFLMGFYQDEIR